MIDVRCSHTENDKNERENSQANQSASEVQRHFGWLNNTSFSFSMGGGGSLPEKPCSDFGLRVIIRLMCAVQAPFFLPIL